MASRGTPHSREDVIALIMGAWPTQVIAEGVRFGLFDALAARERSVADLASASGAHPDGLLRLLRALAVLGLIDQVAPDRFALADAGGHLVSAAPASLAGMAGHWGGMIWEGFTQLGKSVATGERGIPSGPDHFADMQAGGDDATHAFNLSMASGSLGIGRALAATYDFSGVETAMDVGGGYGALLVGLLESCPNIRGQIFDLAGVETQARRYLAGHGLAGRVDFLGGSFFDAVPAGADCLLLKYILHDWDDANAARILRNCHAALGTDGVMLIVERIVPAIVTPADAAVIQGDLVMLSVGGRERTEGEYRTLLDAAGLRLISLIPTATDFAILECRRSDAA